ncbi:MAG: hypothetical protein RLZZ230_297 [Candidatus Parcubacteria bacterium]|jgi:glycosyltransferase involved in cell wall biosynthesis
MEISLVIPAYNEEKFIGACLDSVIKNSAGKLKEIIVVDNASTDATATIARSRLGVRVVYEGRKGTGNARQTGAEQATDDIVAYLDADCLVPLGWIEMIEKSFFDNQVVFLSGPYKYYESTRYPTWLLNSIWLIFVPIAYWIVGFVGNGGNCVVRKSALEKIGGNDRTIAFYGDDTDLARRLHQVGKTLWRNNFNILTSGRRFDEEGISLYFTYLLNYWWPIIFHRPFTKGSHFTKSQSSSPEKNN